MRTARSHRHSHATSRDPKDRPGFRRGNRGWRTRAVPVEVESDALSLIQEGLRGVVRMLRHGSCTGLPRFPVRGNGKNGNDKRVQGRALRGVHVRPGRNHRGRPNRLRRQPFPGSERDGGRVALPVFREIVLSAYGGKMVGPAPQFPAEMEERIDVYLKGDPVEATIASSASPARRPEGAPARCGRSGRFCVGRRTSWCDRERTGACRHLGVETSLRRGTHECAMHLVLRLQGSTETFHWSYVVGMVRPERRVVQAGASLSG